MARNPDSGGLDVREAVFSAADEEREVALKVAGPVPKDDGKQRGSENHQ